MLQDVGDGQTMVTTGSSLRHSRAVNELLSVNGIEIPLDDAAAVAPSEPAPKAHAQHAGVAAAQTHSVDTENLFSPASDRDGSAPRSALRTAAPGVAATVAATATPAQTGHQGSHSPYATPDPHTLGGSGRAPSGTNHGLVNPSPPGRVSGAIRPQLSEEQIRASEKRLKEVQSAVTNGRGAYINTTQYNDSGSAPPVAAGAQRTGEARVNYYVQPSQKQRKPKNALGKFTKVGCLTVSHQWWHILFLVFIVLFFGLIFLTSVVPGGEVFSYVVGAVFMVLSLSCLFLCVCIDPGIVPPAPPSDAPLVPEYVTVNGVEVECKPCRTCNIIRPPRSTHCQFCDVCVEEFDHHCGVLGSCVGRRTYRFFGGFFLSTMVLCFYIFIRSIILLYQVRNTFQETTGQRWQFAAGLVCILASFLGGCFVIPFSFMYVTMACLATTQKEMMRVSAGARVQRYQVPPQQQQQQQPAAAAGVPPTNQGLCGSQFVRNVPYSTNPCLDCLTRFLGPLGTSKIKQDYVV